MRSSRRRNTNCDIMIFLNTLKIFPFLIQSQVPFSFRLVFLLAVSQVCFVHSEIVLSPQVEITNGILLGEVGLSNYDREFYKFWCVPFGKSERWEAAVPPDSWTGIRDATECATRCIQFGMMEDEFMGDIFETTEDCLVLNVFVPKLNDTEKEKLGPLPTVLFIHGGYFQLGSSLEYSGELYMDENVIVITINYRLGPLGFLATGDGVIEGSLGMKDQVLALKWTQENIQYFGGDPKRVTIEGESAGAGSVALLLLSPMAKGLFAGAISQSGSALCPWAYNSKPFETFQNFANELNCSLDTTEESKECLKFSTIADIRRACMKTKLMTELVYPLFPTIETVPPKNPNSQIFLPDHPRRLMEQGRFNRVPYIIGVNEDEGAYQAGLLLHDTELLQDLNDNWLTAGPIFIGIDERNLTKPDINKGLRKMRRFYFGDEDLVTNQVHLQRLTNMFSDSWFIASMRTTIRHYSKYAPVYAYVFTKKGGLRLANMPGWFDRPVTSHGDELQYLFFKGAASDKSDTDFSKVFLKLWVSFFYFQKPTNTWGSAKFWPYVDAEKGPIKFYKIDEDTQLIDDPFQDRGDLWENITDHEWNELKYDDEL